MVETKDRRSQILSVAYETAGRKGLEHVHARSIAAEIGINHAAVHYYYRTRSNLLVALAEYSRSRFESDLQRVTTAQPTPGRKLEAHIALYEAYCRPQSRFFRVLQSLAVAAAYDPLVQEKLVEIHSLQRSRLERDLLAARAEGTLRAESVLAQPDTLQAYLFGLCAGFQLAGGGDPTAKIDALFRELFTSGPPSG